MLVEGGDPAVACLWGQCFEGVEKSSEPLCHPRVTAVFFGVHPSGVSFVILNHLLLKNV